MKYDPYPFQKVAVEHAAQFLSGAENGECQLYAAPTGTGKSIVELTLLERFQDLYIVTPREEIIDGMRDKLGREEKRITTPIKLRNRLMSGDTQPPKMLVFDEGHHHNAETWQQISLLTGLAPSVAYTATPYRGSPRSTRELVEFWGEPLWLITYNEAADDGYIKRPEFHMLPLVDDDVVEVRGGEFDVTSLEGVTVDRLGDVAEHSRRWYSSLWDKPTIYALPTSRACNLLRMELASRGLPSAVVSAATPRPERAAIFEAVKARVLALLHINIVSEGVDLPLRRLVDLAPTLSPVKWVQQLGRVTRPTDEVVEYVCTNRNLMRHAYALDGWVPTSAVVESERVFPQSERACVRALGLEAIGRFKPATVKLTTGLTAHVYSLLTVAGTVVVEYCVLVHPTQSPVWASRVDTIEDGKKNYGVWRTCDPPNDVRGFSSVPASPPSEKQLAWWKRSAARHGLDPDQDVNRRNFPALPVLYNLGARL